MSDINIWIEARKKADSILSEIKGKVIVVNQYYENYDRMFQHNCEVIMVNPFQSFDDNEKFDFYVVVKEIGLDNGIKYHFLLEKILDKLR